METQKVKVHYVGRGVYDEKNFVKEAKEIGVSRALPLHMIKKLKSGQPIYLAQYKNTGKKEFINPKTKVTGETRTQKNVGDAKIFGYFFVEGLNLPASIMDEVREKIPTSEPTESGGGGKPVKRQCGSYIIVSSCTTTASLEEIVEALEEVLREKRKKNPKFKFKTMVTGRFVKLAKPIIKKEEIFCRTLRTMEIPIMSEEEISEDSETKIDGIDNYEHITYYPKGEKVVGSD